MPEQREEQAIKFQRIIYEKCNIDEQITKLSDQERIILREALAQKIAYESVYKNSFPQEQIKLPEHMYRPPSFAATFFCCFYPEENKQNFEITSSVFLKKVCSTFLIFNNRFLSIKSNESAESQPDLYGPLWLSITYIILLGLSANLNSYFTNSTSFEFQINDLIKSFGFAFIFELAQVLVYPAVVGCLGGQMTNLESANLVGYSLVLYFVPTLVCLVPSQIWHMIMLTIAAIFRFIFLGRNYAQKIDSKTLIVYGVIIVIEVLHFYLTISTFFNAIAGQSIDEGINKIFHQRSYVV